MALSDTQKRRLTANAARDKAEALLERLVKVRAESERYARTEPSLPTSKTLAARDALEKAIDSTRQLIDRMNRDI